ncbi:hypothetical protein [uncultured Bradyrhizobium sp.]|uniref:hypothetical protein n=1 Tax=uncultured Bradyrhizobium sp. TaxID=199684 RepID=UPI0035CBDBB7
MATEHQFKPLVSEQLLVPAEDLPSDGDRLWRGHRMIWKRPASWVPQLSAWLAPRFRRDGMRRLKPGLFRDLCWDDLDWSRTLEKCLTADIDYHTEELAEAIEPAILRTYHGCRTADAGIYHREGLHTHDRPAMIKRLQAIVEAHPELQAEKDRLPEAIAAVDNKLDQGRVFVVADDQALITEAAHYLIYGSEWISSVLAFHRHVLKKIGAPTLLEIDMPLIMSSFAARREFATQMLREWTRLTCNQPDWSAPINFTFTLRVNIPPECVIRHSHPRELVDPLAHFSTYRVLKAECANCRS